MPTHNDWQKIISACENGVRLQVKISPGASRTKILGPHGECLKIAVGAPPEKGKANQALIQFLSKLLAVPKQNITIESGMTSPRKTLVIQNLTPEQCRSLLIGS
ncbi:MAG: DUF167 domain-containing protein [Phycisphaerae bacterium]